MRLEKAVMIVTANSSSINLKRYYQNLHTPQTYQKQSETNSKRKSRC